MDLMKYNTEEYAGRFRLQYDTECLKKQFRNVYFIIGTAYAGKSTMVRMLSEHYDGILCEENYGLKYLDEYGVNSEEHPCLCYTDNHSMVEFVNRTPDEYCDWLRGSEIEITPIEIGELQKLTAVHPDQKIFVDTSIPMEVLRLISGYNNVAVMLSDQSVSVNRFFERPDYEKQIIFRAIRQSDDPEEAMANYRRVLEQANSPERYRYFENSGFYVFKRDDSLTLKETMDRLAQHFGLEQPAALD